MKQATAALLIVLAVLSSTSFASGASGLGDANDFVGLEDYLRYAALSNAALKASFESWKAAVESIPQAKSLPDPKFTYGYFITEVETRVGPQRQKFDLMQTFPWFGVIKARTDRASAKAKAAHKRYEAKKLELFQQVKHAFYEYGYLAKAIEITKESLELIEGFEEVARIKYVGAASTHPDITRAQIELAIVEDRLRSLEELRPAVAAQLNSILNRPLSGHLPWPQSQEYQQTSISFSKLYALIVQNNPDLQAVEYEIEAMRKQETLARKRSYPNIGIGVSYIDTAHAMASGVRDSGKDPIMAMISLNVPIWTDNYRAAQRQARAQLIKTTQDKIQLENTLGASARQLLYEFEDTARKIRLYKGFVIPKTKEMVEASVTAYSAAAIDFLSLLDAQDKLLGYGLLYERAVARNAQKLAKLERLAGTSLPGVDANADSTKEPETKPQKENTEK